MGAGSDFGGGSGSAGASGDVLRRLIVEIGRIWEGEEACVWLGGWIARHLARKRCIPS